MPTDTVDPATSTPLTVTDGPDIRTIGRSGLMRFGGTVREEWLDKLKGSRGYKMYLEMYDNSPDLGAIFRMLFTAVRSTPVMATPAAPTKRMKKDPTFNLEAFNAEAERWAEFLDEVLEDMSHSWQYFVGEAATAAPFGYAVHEIDYKRRMGPDQTDPTLRSKFSDGLWGWRRFQFRAQDTLDRWQFDEDEGIAGMWQKLQPEMIPIQKMLLFTFEGWKGNPEGRSLLRNAFWAYYMMTSLQELEAVVYERGPGIPIVYVPPRLLSPRATADETTELNNYLKMGAQIRVGDRVAIAFPSAVDEKGAPTGYKLEFLGGLQAVGAIRGAIQDYRKEIFTSLAHEFMILGQNEHGSYALVNNLANGGLLLIESVVDLIINTVNKYGVSRLMRYNGVPQEYWPKLTHGQVSKIPLSDLASFFLPAFEKGLLPRDSNTLDWLRRQSGAPQPATNTEDGDMNPEFEDVADFTGSDASVSIRDKDTFGLVVDLAARVQSQEVSVQAAVAILQASMRLETQEALKLLGKTEEDLLAPAPSRRPPSAETQEAPVLEPEDSLL